MNIWAWVHDKDDSLREEGHDRLADIIDELPSLVVNNDIEQVESMVPEGLALARSLNDKWVELFIRHWNLQSLVLTRMEVKDALPEAISLLEFSHQDDTKECPQSVCVVQDLACCYAHQDGPGFAEQRKEVALEAFERIDASWSCFTCIAQEYANALLDQKKYDEVLAFVDDCDVKLQKAGEGRDTGYLLRDRIYAMIALGQLEEAEKASKRLSNPYGGESFEVSKKITQAMVQAHLGNIKKALRLLPDHLDKNQQCDYLDWVKTHYIISQKSQEHNNVKLAMQINRMIQQLLQQGVYRDSLNLSFMACRLAMSRKQLLTAQVLINACPAMIKNLQLDMGAEEELAAIKQEMSQFKPEHPALPGNADDFIDSLSDDETYLEDNLALLTAAHKAWPDNEDILILMASNLESMGFISQARELLLDYLGHNPNAARILNAYGGYLIDEQSEDFMGFIEHHKAKTQDPVCQQNIQWLLARYHRKMGQLKDARQYLEAMLQDDPSLFNTRLFLTSILRDLEEYQLALDHVEILLENEGEEDLHWDRMVLATFLEDWQKVRESSEKAGVKIEGEGPINESWGACRIQLREHKDKPIFYATRTGPVTARIDGISRIDDTQHYHDEVIFDPFPLNQLNIKDEEGDMVDEEGYDTYVYPCVKIIRPSEYITYDIDGVHPGEDKVKALMDMLVDLGAVVNLRSSEEYELYNLEEDKEYTGFYAYFLLKPDIDLTLVNKKLKEFCQDLAQPLVWTKLLQTVNDEETLATQMAIKDRFDME